MRVKLKLEEGLEIEVEGEGYPPCKNYPFDFKDFDFEIEAVFCAEADVTELLNYSVETITELCIKQIKDDIGEEEVLTYEQNRT